MGILLVPNFTILVRQHFAGFYFRVSKGKKKVQNQDKKSTDTRVFTINFNCCFTGLTGI